MNANVEPLRLHKEHPMKTQWAPALVLLVLAPLCGELLSSSMPPAEWLNPVGVALVVILYGGGALLVREAVVRSGRGWLAWRGPRAPSSCSPRWWNWTPIGRTTPPAWPGWARRSWRCTWCWHGGFGGVGGRPPRPRRDGRNGRLGKTAPHPATTCQS